MSRTSVLSEATSKMMELESIKSSDAFGKTDYGIKRAKVLFTELSELRYTNAMCGEHEMEKWLLSLQRKFATHFSN